MPPPPTSVSRGRPGRRRHALLIDSTLPGPATHPAARPLLSQAASLRRLGYEVSFCPADLCLDRAQEDGCGTGRPVEPSELERLGVACLGRPAYRSVEEVLSRNAGTFDVVILHGGLLAQAYAPVVRLHGPAARVLFCAGALTHLRLARQAALLRRPDLMIAAQAAQRREMLAAYASDATLVHSAHEARLLHAALPGHAVHGLPWSLDEGPPEARRTGGLGVGFRFRLQDEAEADAAQFLLHAVMPLVWVEQPALRLVVAGDAVPAELRAHAAVTVLDDAGALLQQVRLTVAPLRFGSGVSPAVVESLAAGVPCAMSPVAAEGLALPHAAAEWVAPEGDALAAGLAAIILGLHRRRPADNGWGTVMRQAWSGPAVDAALRMALDGAQTRLRAVQ